MSSSLTQIVSSKNDFSANRKQYDLISLISESGYSFIIFLKFLISGASTGIFAYSAFTKSKGKTKSLILFS